MPEAVTPAHVVTQGGDPVGSGSPLVPSGGVGRVAARGEAFDVAQRVAEGVEEH